jgi:hypothetical protein
MSHDEDYRDGDCKGGQGYSWFSLYYEARGYLGGKGHSWFQVDLTSDYVPDESMGIFLDTTPPERPTFIVNNGESSTEEQIVTAYLAHCDYPVRPGYQIKIWGDVDTEYDPAIARQEENSEWVAFSPTYLFKLSRFNGSKRVYAKIRDDVWNETETLTVSIAFTGGEDPVVEVGKAADGPSFTSAPLIGQEFEQSWAAEIDTRLPSRNLAEVSGSIAAVRTINASVSGTGRTFKSVEFKISGQRQEASRWNRIISDEEELLLNL